ncbi:MAG: hypothetical protein ABEK50_15380 [bacterium]
MSLHSISSRRIKKAVFVLLGVIVVSISSGCATNVSHYQQIEQSLVNENHEKVIQLLEKAREKGSYEEKDRVLYSLELGLAQHYAGLYEDSNNRLSRADQYIDDLYTKSISNMGYSFLTNSSQLPYRGEPHENIYLNAFKAFNYAQIGKPQDVFVEVRKLDNKLGRMETEFKRMAEDYKQSAVSSLGEDFAPPDDKASFEAGETKFHTSALGRYLGYVMYLTERDQDDARIDLNKMREAFQNQPGIYNFDFPDIPESVDVPSGKARVNVFALLGRGPIKKQKTVRAQYKDVYVKWVYPVLQERGTSIDRVVVERNGRRVAQLDEIEDINRVSKAIFEVKQPIIKAYNFVRALSKALAAREARQNSNTGLVGFAASVAAQEFTENADLRTTRLLPGEVHVGHFTVPDGELVDLTVNYYADGKRVDSRKIKQKFHRGKPNFLEVVNFK